MKLIDNWRQAWRFASVQIGALAVVWVALPADTQAAVLDLVGLDPAKLPAIVGLAVIVGRLIAQPKVYDEQAD